MNKINIGYTKWEDVPEDLIYLLVNKIESFSTFIRFGLVCQFWHSIASANKFCKHIPWLMLSEKEDTDMREFYDLSTKEVYELPLPEAKGKKILGSAYGWLVTVGEDGQFNLLNPVNRLQIALPPQSSFQSVPTWLDEFTPQKVRDLFTGRATLSQDPATGDFIAMVTHLGMDTSGVSFCRSSDSKWTRMAGTGIDFMLDFAQGLFFATTSGGKLLNYKMNSTPKTELVTVLHPFDAMGSYYVVECDGEILFVSRFRLIEDDACGEIWEGWEHRTYSFAVHKLNLKNKYLTEVKSIGDYAIFVGFNSTMCLPVTPDTKAYKKNCIYFTDDYTDGIFVEEESVGGLDMGIFSLDDGSFEPHYHGISKSKFSISIWFVPRFT